ncbi:MAG: phosphate ABC transporter permease PstA [Acidobacteriota bacterium]
MREQALRWPDRVVAVACWLSAALVASVFVWILADLLRDGFSGLSWSFLITAPQDAGRAGGIGPIVVSTLLILAVCLAVAVPLGLGTAALLAEFTPSEGRFATLVRRSLDILAGIPSIVFGLFGNVLFSRVLGLGFSILSGGLTLACMVLPILIRTAEEALRATPRATRMGAAALGLSRCAILFHLLLPSSAPGLTVGIVLGIGRALAETAALIFTSGYVARLPGSLFDSGRTLSVHIYDLSMNVPGGEANAASSALVLMGLLLAINLAAASLGDRWLGGRGRAE